VECNEFRRVPKVRTSTVRMETAMEACILKFKKTDLAEEALNKVVAEKVEQEPWLHEVGVIKRPILGRISIRATYADPSEIHEGDVAAKLADAGKWTGYLVGSIAGPMHARVEALRAKRAVAPVAKRLEKALLGIDDIKDLLPRGSSALVLVAGPEVCNRLVDLFSSWQPELTRRDLSSDIQGLLDELHREVEGRTEAAAQ
jgi:hypothetical protein